MTIKRKPIQIDRDKLRAAVRKLSNEYVFYMLSRHYSYGCDKMLAHARRTATADQRKALAAVNGA